MKYKILNNILKLIYPDSMTTKINTELNNKVILITGASRGIGKAIAVFLSNEGCKLVLISRNIDTNVLKDLKNRGSHLIINADITKEEDVQKAISKTMKKFGKVDVLVNNTGIFLDKPLEDVLSKEFYSIIESNFKGLFLMTNKIIPLMKQRKDGLIINIGSKISHNTNVAPNKILYATTKYAVEGFSLSLNKELKKSGIRVTCLMPGTVNTFVSLKSKQFLPPDSIGYIISFIIKAKNIDFESIVFKSKLQNI